MAERLTTMVSTKGQVILPKVLRDRHRWPAGTKLVVEDQGNGIFLHPEPLFPATTIAQVRGSLGYNGPPLSLEDMDAAINAEAELHARRRY